MYMQGLIQEVAKAMPDVKFKFFGGSEKRTEGNVEYTGWTDMSELIKESSILTRFTVHDGLPIGALEFILAGRQVLSNLDLPHFTNCKPTKEEIIKGIRRIQKETKLNKKGRSWWLKRLDHKKFKRQIRKFL
jgi:hypothetical protein